MNKFIFGCGAQGRVVKDVLTAQYPDCKLYFVDENIDLIHSLINNIEVISIDEMMVIEKKPQLHIAIGNPLTREKICNNMVEKGCLLLSAIHPDAVIMPTASVDKGCMVAAGAIINTNAKISRCCIVNTGAIIEHDTEMEEFSCVSPGATIGGRVKIGKGSFIASASVVLARVLIGDKAIVGMGSVVIKDVENNDIVFGVPAKQHGKVDEHYNWNKLF